MNVWLMILVHYFLTCRTLAVQPQKLAARVKPYSSSQADINDQVILPTSLSLMYHVYNDK